MRTYLYNCPICLRYYNSKSRNSPFLAILVFDCCSNYVCHRCLDLLLLKYRRQLKGATKKSMDCPMCGKAVTLIGDVNTNAKVEV